MTEDKLIETTDKIISELVYPKYELQKAYNYYNGVLDADQYRYIEEQYGIGNPTSVEFIPLIRKHVDALVGEYLGTPIIPKVTCKDSSTISKITREKELTITKELLDFLNKRLSNKLIQFMQTGDKGQLKDQSVQDAIDKLKEDLNDSFVSEYEIAAQNVIQYLMQSRNTDIKNKLKQLFTDLLITGYTFYKVVNQKDNVNIEALNPLNTFIDKNPESPYVKDSQRAVVRKWLTKNEILNIYGKKLSKKDRDTIEDAWKDAFNTSAYYVRNVQNSGVPSIEGIQADKFVTPGYPTGNKFSYNYRFIPVYEVEWIETDKDFVMQRYRTVRIGQGIYILYGKDENVIRSQDNPTKCTLSINGVYYTNRNSEPYSLVLTCSVLQDKYNILHFFRDNIIANSGTIGDFVDVSVLPKFLGNNLPERLQKWIAYKKSGIAPIDSSQEGSLSAGQAPINTIYNGFDDTVKAQAIQAIQIAIDSIEQTTSSITGVFRERLNGIQQRDAVTNVQVSVNNSFTITKQYYQQMDTVVEEVLLDALNLAKIVYRNGLQGTLILGDKYQKVFTALPEYFTLSDYDIHIVTSSDLTKQLEQLKAIIPEFVKVGAIPPDLIMEALTCQSLTDFKIRVKKAFEKQKAENNQLQKLQQESEQLQQQLQEASKQIKEAQTKIQSLNEAKLKLEAEKNKAEVELNWYKAKTDRQYKEAKAEQDAKRTRIELLQLHDGNPYNDEVVNLK